MGPAPFTTPENDDHKERHVTAKYPTRKKAAKALRSPVALPQIAVASDGATVALRLTLTGVTL
jgi:hypothetical protein